MLYRQFYTWADTSTLPCIYLTCIRPHLEYACQLWDPYTDKGTQALESVQKFACKVCLKQWDMDYESMLEQLELTSSPGWSTFADHTRSCVDDTRVSLFISLLKNCSTQSGHATLMATQVWTMLHIEIMSSISATRLR